MKLNTSPPIKSPSLEARPAMNSPGYQIAPHQWGYRGIFSQIYLALFSSPAIYRGASQQAEVELGVADHFLVALG